jgi:predicted transcriptional regulator
MTSIQSRFAAALKSLTPTMEDVGRWLGMSTSALRRYRLGNRGISPAVVSGLVKLLRKQARTLDRIASDLESTHKGGKDA